MFGSFQLEAFTINSSTFDCLFFQFILQHRQFINLKSDPWAWLTLLSAVINQLLSILKTLGVVWQKRDDSDMRVRFYDEEEVSFDSLKIVPITSVF